MVLQGDVLDGAMMSEANMAMTETVIAVTNDDETNILSSLLAKREGAQRAITLINKGEYEQLIGSLGIDVVVDPRNITVSTIIQHVRRGRIHSVHTLGEGFGELIEAEALTTSPMVGMPLKEANLPDGLVIGAVVRGDEIINPRGNTVINAGDRVVMFETGQFSMLWRELAERLGLDVDMIAGDWRSGADASELQARLNADKTHAIKAVCVVHNDTSTGITSNIAALRKALDDAKHPALLMVDTISSLGSIDYRHDEWGVDEIGRAHV